MASNLIFPYLLLCSGNLSRCSKDSELVTFGVVFVHFFVSVMTQIGVGVLSCMGKLGKRKNTFKFFLMIAGIALILVLVLVIIDNQKDPTEIGFYCVPFKFVKQSYLYINIVALLGMMTILLSIKDDRGEDLRDEVLTKHRKMIEENDYMSKTTA